MFAVVEINGNQYKVAKGEVFDIDRMEEANPGDKLTFDTVVLMASSEKEANIGQPYVAGAKVECKVVSHHKGDKIEVIKFTAKKRYQRKQGHRQRLTKLEVTDIKG